MMSRTDWLSLAVIAAFLVTFFTFAVGGTDPDELVAGNGGPKPAQGLMGEGYWR